MLEGVTDRIGRQQSTILAEGEEQHPVEQFLGTAEDFRGGDHGVRRAQPGENLPPNPGIKAVEFIRQLLADRLGGPE